MFNDSCKATSKYTLNPSKVTPNSLWLTPVIDLDDMKVAVAS